MLGQDTRAAALPDVPLNYKTDRHLLRFVAIRTPYVERQDGINIGMVEWRKPLRSSASDPNF